jgi:hypothetical protein
MLIKKTLLTEKAIDPNPHLSIAIHYSLSDRLTGPYAEL